MFQPLQIAVHVAKRKRQGFSNCFLWVDDVRIHLVQLRELRNDPSLYSELSKLIPLSAVRNRDRQDVESVLQISAPAVTDVLKTNAAKVTHTVVPEKYRITDDNKKGVLKSPVAVAMGPLGNIFISDIGTRNVLKVRASHYPANVTVEVDSLDCPVGIALQNGVLYIAESRKCCIVFKDLTGQTVVDPNKLTVPQLRQTLKEAGAWDDGDSRKKKKPLKEKLQQVIKEKLSKRGSAACSNKLQMENDIQNPLALIFDKDGNLFVSTKQGTVFKIKVESDLVSLKGVVVAQIAIGYGLLYGMAILNDVLYVASHDDDGGIFTVNFQDKKVEKVVGNGAECLKVHSVTVYENKLLFSDVGDHSLKVCNSVTRECIPYSENGKGTRDGKSAQFVQPAGVLADRKTVFVVDCSTGCLRMISEVPPLVRFLSSLHEFSVTFGLHLKKQIPTPFTIDAAITRIK